MGTVTKEELAGSETPGRGSNQDHNLGSFALPSSPRSPGRVERGKCRFQMKRILHFCADHHQSTENGTSFSPSAPSVF